MKAIVTRKAKKAIMPRGAMVMSLCWQLATHSGGNFHYMQGLGRCSGPPGLFGMLGWGEECHNAFMPGLAHCDVYAVVVKFVCGGGEGIQRIPSRNCAIVVSDQGW